jgi:hypothetical protein
MTQPSNSHASREEDRAVPRKLCAPVFCQTSKTIRQINKREASRTASGHALDLV